MTGRAVRYPYDAALAVETLRSRDRRLAAVMDRVGPFALRLRDDKTPFQALMQSVVYQQLSGRSAAAIHARVLRLFPRRYASARGLQSISDDHLAAAGLSRAKTRSLRDLAAGSADGRLPHASRLKGMTDDDIVAHLQRLRGVGLWTAEMLLIFNLGRPDVLPAGDLGVRRGYRKAYRLRSDPDPARLVEHGERWRPYRTVATWYLWQASRLTGP